MSSAGRVSGRRSRSNSLLECHSWISKNHRKQTRPAMDGDWGCLMELSRWGSLDSFGESYLGERRKECLFPTWFAEPKEGVDTSTKASFHPSVSQHILYIYR